MTFKFFCFVILSILYQIQADEIYLFFFREYKYPYYHKKELSTILKSQNIQFSYQSQAEHDFGCHEIIPTDFIKVKISANKIKMEKMSRELPLKFPNIIKRVLLDKKIRGKLFDSKSFLPLKPSADYKTKYQYHFASNTYDMLEIEKISSEKKTKGKNVRVAIFDTGVSENFENKYKEKIKEIKNWTKEKYFGTDFNGHGTFIASLFVNQNKECLGISPEVDLFIFKVFTKSQESYTSWFLEAFNYAIYMKVDLINFSIGSTDFTEEAFIEKIREVVSHKITIVSASGNDGPFLGTVNNPADLIDVLAVGGVDSDSETVAAFSSRGMTTWELLQGNGRVKPEILSYSKFVLGADLDSGNCVMKSGTSLATGVITASLALIISYLRENNLENFINPATLRQCVLASGIIINDFTIYEQGAGLFNLKKAFEFFDSYQEQMTVFPQSFNLSNNYFYNLPYSNQPLYKNSMPNIFNITLLQGISNVNNIVLEAWEWNDNSTIGKVIQIDIETNLHQEQNNSSYFYFLGFFLNIIQDYNYDKNVVMIKGNINLKLRINQTIAVILKVDFVFDWIDTPSRMKRLLWDQFHNMKFPESNYIPRDSLTNYDFPYEWYGDHPYTNFFSLMTFIRSQGYFLEILRGTFNCFDANNYAAILIVDPEEIFGLNEIEKIENDVIKNGLSLIIFADWFDLSIIEKNIYFNPSKSENVKPIVGGSNIPSLNDLLKPFDIALGRSVFSGDLQLLNKTISYFSGSYIIKFPANGYLFTFDLFNETDLILTSKPKIKEKVQHIPILGLLKNIHGIEDSGKIMIYGDSNCIDSSYLVNDCFDLFKDFLRFIENKKMRIFDEFHYFQLPLAYEDEKEKPIYFEDWKSKQIFLKFSKFKEKKNTCKRISLFDKELISHLSEIEKAAFKSIHYSYNANKIHQWVTNQKSSTNLFPELNLMLTTEYIHLSIMAISLGLVIFFIILIRKKKSKRHLYSHIPNKDPIMLV